MMTLNNDQAANEEATQLVQLTRSAVSFFEKFERYECQEVLAYSSTHWMLSNEDFRLPTDNPMGLISSSTSVNSNQCVILFPEDSDSAPLDYRELHMIIRELTYGIYIMHQTPLICLEANYDQSTSCQLPPAYHDTRVGQIMINVDYIMKCLWHGAYFPKEKRSKFSERWRSNLNINQNGKPETKKSLLTEFLNAGMTDITSDADFTHAYDKLPVEQPGDAEMAEERRFFMSHVDDIVLQLTLFQNTVTYFRDMFVVDADFLVTSNVKLLDEGIDHTGYERLKTRLQMHEDMIRDNLLKKAEVRHHLQLLKFISYMSTFLISMKRRMKIPDLSCLLFPLTGDECHTERELPPLIIASDFKCKNFSFGGRYFHLHGGINIDIETDPLADAGPAFEVMYEQIHRESRNYLEKVLDPDSMLLEFYKVPTFEIDGKRYLAIMVNFETYYGSVPHKPLWVQVFHEEMAKLKVKKLPVNDIHLHEQFKKFFGFKKAMRLKTPIIGLTAASQRGYVSAFQALCRKIPNSRLGKQDEQGMSLLHYAAIYNRPQIIAVLLSQSMDVNVRRNSVPPAGPTVLHLAARCGSLDAVECLLCCFANILANDHDGWAPIHHAAFFDHASIIKVMIRKNVGLLEVTTKNAMKSTPLLLAASSGALSAVKCLIELSADIRRVDGQGDAMVILAAMRFHTNVLEYLIEWNNENVPVWDMLVEMIVGDNIDKKDSAVKCLEVLSTCQSHHWKSILDAGGVPALLSLFRLDSEEIQSVAASVLCNISENKEVRVALTEADAGSVLVILLGSPVDDIQSRAAIILSDMVCIDGNQDKIASIGGIEPVINLLDSELEDVLVNAVNVIRVLVLGNHANQSAMAASGAIEPLVEFLSVSSDDLQAGSAAALSAMCTDHELNQDLIMKEGAAKPLVDLIRSSRNTTVQLKAASAVEALANNNPDSQRVFLESNLDAPKSLIRLLKKIYIEVREQVACALLALAGHTKTQQKYIAQRITIPHIIQMLLEPTRKLLYVGRSTGCMMAIALGRENMGNQNKLAEADAFQQLVRLLRTRKADDSVLLTVIKVLGILCIGVAHRNNTVTQRYIAEEGGIPVLVHILMNPPSQEVQVEVAISLGSVVLSNRANQEKLQEEDSFKFDILLNLLTSDEQDIRLRAGMALTIFAFNNTQQQFAIREAGGIRFSIFQQFINSEDTFHQCHAAFQAVVLARVIRDQDQVQLTALGIKLLVKKLTSDDDKILVLACSLLSSLAHTRAGVPDAMIATGAIDLLVGHLNSANDQVRNAASVTLGYMTFNGTAARSLFSICRNTPGLFKKLIANIGLDPRISEQFKTEFERAKMIGLPSKWLEVNGGRPVHTPAKGKRPQTTRHKENAHVPVLRGGSAPHKPDSIPSITVVRNEENDAQSVSVSHTASATSQMSRTDLSSGKPGCERTQCPVVKKRK